MSVGTLWIISPDLLCISNLDMEFQVFIHGVNVVEYILDDSWNNAHAIWIMQVPLNNHISNIQSEWWCVMIYGTVDMIGKNHEKKTESVKKHWVSFKVANCWKSYCLLQLFSVAKKKN